MHNAFKDNKFKSGLEFRAGRALRYNLVHFPYFKHEETKAQGNKLMTIINFP